MKKKFHFKNQPLGIKYPSYYKPLTATLWAIEVVISCKRCTLTKLNAHHHILSPTSPVNWKIWAQIYQTLVIILLMPLSPASNNESTTFAHPLLASFFIDSAYHILYKGVSYTPSSLLPEDRFQFCQLHFCSISNNNNTTPHPYLFYAPFTFPA